MYDAIVIGARCAGAPTAMLLARKGWRVLLVDRATFPRDIPHGHFIHRDGPRRLARWGLLDRVTRHCPPVTSFTLDLGDFPPAADDLVADGIAFGYGPRRSHLDRVLADAAVEAGAEFRQGFTVEAIGTDGDRVTGVTGRSEGSAAAVTEQARITIGADGRRSMLAAAVRAREFDACPTATCWYFSYWSGVPSRGLEVYVRGASVIFAFPTSDDRFAIFVAWPADRLAAIKEEIERHFLSAIDGVLEFATRVRSDAFRDVDLLVEAIDDGLTGRVEMQAALASYERRRNEATREDYWQNLSGARFEAPPEPMMRIRAALRGNADATRQFFLAREKTIGAAVLSVRV